jgi:hypothetical protein
VKTDHMAQTLKHESERLDRLKRKFEETDAAEMRKRIKVLVDEENALRSKRLAISNDLNTRLSKIETAKAIVVRNARIEQLFSTGASFYLAIGRDVGSEFEDLVTLSGAGCVV